MELIPSAESPPERLLLSVTEAARLLGIGRSHAYELARRYLATGGTDGLPVLKLGSRLRVPRWTLLELARTGRIVQLAEGTTSRGDRRGLAG